ncbi:MAG: hypothetical protein ABJI60_09190, partial [Kangiellaceae bacterium]
LVDHQLGCLQTEFRTEVSSFRHRLHLIHYVSDHTLKIRWPKSLCHYKPGTFRASPRPSKLAVLLAAQTGIRPV